MRPRISSPSFGELVLPWGRTAVTTPSLSREALIFQQSDLFSRAPSPAASRMGCEALEDLLNCPPDSWLLLPPLYREL